jgi:hypothetical protein
MKNRALVLIGCFLVTSTMFATECVKNARGKTVCSNGHKAVAVNPNTGTVKVAQKNPHGVTTTQTSNGGTVNTNNGVTVAQGAGGSTAAVNQRTGNAAVSQTNQNGVKTTQTSRGGTAKTKNGVGVAQGPGGTTCVKGKNQQGCK